MFKIHLPFFTSMRNKVRNKSHVIHVAEMIRKFKRKKLKFLDKNEKIISLEVNHLSSQVRQPLRKNERCKSGKRYISKSIQVPHSEMSPMSAWKYFLFSDQPCWVASSDWIPSSNRDSSHSLLRSPCHRWTYSFRLPIPPSSFLSRYCLLPFEIHRAAENVEHCRLPLLTTLQIPRLCLHVSDEFEHVGFWHNESTCTEWTSTLFNSLILEADYLICVIYAISHICYIWYTWHYRDRHYRYVPRGIRKTRWCKRNTLYLNTGMNVLHATLSIIMLYLRILRREWLGTFMKSDVYWNFFSYSHQTKRYRKRMVTCHFPNECNCRNCWKTKSADTGRYESVDASRKNRVARIKINAVNT